MPSTSTRVQALAERFMNAAASVMLAAGLCPETLWRAPRHEGQSLADLTYRLAQRYHTRWQSIAATLTSTATPAAGDERAATPANAHLPATPANAHLPAGRTQQDVLDDLRRAADAVTQGILSLTDQQLDRRVHDPSQPGKTYRVEDLVKARLIIPTQKHFRRYVALWERQPGAFHTSSSRPRHLLPI